MSWLSLDSAAGLFGGFADTMTFGLVTRFNNWVWGDIAQQNQYTNAWVVGQVLGTGVQFGLGYGGAACGTGLLLTTARVYNMVDTAYGVGQAGYHVIHDGSMSISDGLMLAGAVGWGLGKMFNQACFVAGTEVWLDEEGPPPLKPGETVPPADQAAGDAVRTVCTVAMVGVGLGGWQTARRQRRRQEDEQSEQRAAMASLFAEEDGGPLGDDDEETALALAHVARRGGMLRAQQGKGCRSSDDRHREAALDTLCDSLFHGRGELGDASGCALSCSAGTALAQRGVRASARLDRPTAERNHCASEMQAMPTSLNNRRPTQAKSRARRGVFGLAWLAGFLILAAWIGFASPRVRWLPAHASSSASAVSAVSPVPSHSTPIDKVAVGDRTLGRNPLRDQVDPNAPEPDPETWGKLVLRMKKDSGRSLYINLLRPLEWIEEAGAETGSDFFLNLPEMGAVGNAYVDAIERCPPMKRGIGNVVTGTFHHEADPDTVILQVDFSNGTQIKGVTDNHPFWSEDRRQFVRIDELKRGDHVRLSDGIAAVAAVSSRVAFPGEMLHNLEVHNEHVYQVTTAGILVHNACADRLRGAMKRAGVYGDGGAIPHHMVSRFDARALKARDILSRNGVDIDSHWNGIFLRGSDHKGLHTNAYYQAITERLALAEARGGRAHVLHELQQIRNQLAGGTFPF